MPDVLTRPAFVFTVGILLTGSQAVMTADYGRIGEPQAHCDPCYGRSEGRAL
jgi:hypothetical protein